MSARIDPPGAPERQTRLVLLRHGEALGVAGRCIGQTDVPLSRDGAAAIRRLVADGPESLIGTFDGRTRVFSSDLRRATESAAIVATAVGCDSVQDARLREISFGEWDGQPWSDIECAYPEQLRSWMELWTESAAPGGESVGDLVNRAAEWIGDVVTGQSSAIAIVVVSHAGWIRAAVSHLLGYDIARMFEIPVDHARMTIIDVGAAGATLVASNVKRLA